MYRLFYWSGLMIHEVYCENNICGRVNVYKEELLTAVELDSAVVPFIARLVYRNGADIFSVGIPIPEGGRLRLKKRFARFFPDGAGNGIYELIDVSTESEKSKEEPLKTVSPLPDGWTPEPDPSRLFKSERLIRACRNVSGACTFTKDGRGFLAVPISTSEPFPLASYLLYGTPYKTEGGYYMVFRLKNGSVT